ncbi:class I SAM-dependent methyltransferase [Paramaledivibacter caminithermalis]|jgi:SAM-dependent methyltransferase|uniref:Methyltransferase domain-containing protein n=1 Tax=Paramaledivibacter caminithermalis (strain DSM 15212 / CIP 107654 / DViRD3) TaxID=1121301 RepID=A0A1M6LS39_PARC5|nr:SAM-dependent methyltransferase [Paramaledivibacter caminithermalis]SHJ73997.1 Methyltransferase domain-containing protein [Paramaledivibacter caminithermalis DSM 15212]
MDNKLKLLDIIIEEEKFIHAVLSNVRKKSGKTFNKVSVKPVLIKNKLLFQFTYHYDKNVIHKNYTYYEAEGEINNLIKSYFKQGVIYTVDADYQVLVSKKGKIKILKKSPTRKRVNLSHNRKKSYILEEDKPYEFLIKLGVMNEKGRILAAKYDKFKQLNRFLEMVSDCIPYLNKEKTINIIDFGCGKSYLTFALYHYLVYELGLDINVIGLDLKKDVIDFCNEIADELNYDRLKFIHGDIKGFEGIDKIDMVVSLHACDTATDDAITKAVNWKADVILAVPCCQHELFNKIHNPIMKPMEKYGIIREKLSTIVTDSIRASVLEIMGYSVQMLEFIDMEHTPKNILIRAFKNNKLNKEAVSEYKKFKKFWGVEPYIEGAMGDEFLKKL